MVESISQLSAIVAAYPWCAAARAALCRKVFEESGADAARGIFRESLPYLPYASYLAASLNSNRNEDLSDASLAGQVKEIIDSRPRIILVGQDFFSREEYESARIPEDSELGRLAAVDCSKPVQDGEYRRSGQNGVSFWSNNADGTEAIPDMVTETLAEIFAEQGYPDKAILIYEKLSLQSPEKSAYFANLIGILKEKLKK